MIEIDLTDFIPESVQRDFDPRALRGIMLDVVDAARAKWVRLAMDELHSSQQEYVKGISGVRVEGDVAYITLDGAFPNMIERGFSPFDLRDSLLGPGVPIVESGKGKRESADGNFYRFIFFRIMGSAATGRNGQRSTDLYASELGERRAAQLGKVAEKAMRKLPATRSNPGEKTQWGGRLKTVGTDLDVLGTSHRMETAQHDGFDIAGSSSGGVMAKPGETVLHRHGGAQHKAPLFEGAYRFEQTYKTKTQSFYGTFRTISTSEPDGWIHPGHQPGAQLADKVNEYAMKLAGDLFAGLAKGT